jgi:hypothetical protein
VISCKALHTQDNEEESCQKQKPYSCIQHNVAAANFTYTYSLTVYTSGEELLAVDLSAEEKRNGNQQRDAQDIMGEA